jgi:hypothetical protein
MGYVRFALSLRHPESGVEDGLFRVAYGLRGHPAVDADDRDVLSELLLWFEKNLPTPARFNRSRSKGFYSVRHVESHGFEMMLWNVSRGCTN